MFGKVQDDSFTHIFDLSLDSEDKFGSSFQHQGQQSTSNYGIKMSSTSSSPLSSRRDFSSPSSTISTPSSTSSLPLEAAFSQFAASFSSLLADKEAAASAASSLDKKIAELERLKNKINNSDSHSSASSTTSTGSASTGKVNTSRYKTELCRPFSEHGTCKYGEKCQFAHGMAELRTVARHPKYKTDLCRTYHSVGFCPYGPRCHFIHNLEEAKEQERQKASKAIGSGRAPEVGNQLNSKPLKPLPMFDSQKQQQNGSSWNPLHSNLFNNEQVEQKTSCRLPVFSTLSK